MSGYDVGLVPARRLIVAPVDAHFALAPGDRALVSAGDSVVLGAPIIERLRDPRLEELDAPDGVEPQPGERWQEPPRRNDPNAPPSLGTGTAGSSLHGTSSRAWPVSSRNCSSLSRDRTTNRVRLPVT